LLENWTAAAALAAEISKIEIIAAIKPLLFHPVVLAKMALQIENISGGRFGINLVPVYIMRQLLARLGIAEEGTPDAASDRPIAASGSDGAARARLIS